MPFPLSFPLGIIRFNPRRGARVADWGGLENRCGSYGPPWVRIPPPPLIVFEPALVQFQIKNPVVIIRQGPLS